MRTLYAAVCVWAASCAVCGSTQAETVEVDLLVVGGSESAAAAVVQAARMGCKSIAWVNDGDWIGGQFSSEGLGAVDEWTQYEGTRTPFPRSGAFLEIMERIELHNLEKYGMARPGNCFCAWTTIEPQAAEKIFRDWTAPYLAPKGPAKLFENWTPVEVLRKGAVVQGAVFAPTGREEEPNGLRLTVQARITIDAGDWGDVVRLSGAKYRSGPDLKQEFNEPGAPDNYGQVGRNEMNPLTYCLVLRESDVPAVVPEPAGYDERQFYGATLATRVEYATVGWPAGTMKPFAAVWKRSLLTFGPYTEGPSVYHHRRLVDRRNNGLAPGAECILVNWPIQDYPTYDFPQSVVDDLERHTPGASKKNMVDMTPAQRRIVLEDAKRHSLKMLYSLQTMAHEKDPDQSVTFRNMRLTDEFGTPDRLPKKPYLRETLRTECMYMMREQDIRDEDGRQSWARHMTPDGVFGFQFNIDYHPTRRVYLKDDRTGPWAHIHSKHRNWSTHTDRACFPLRSVVPVETEGLLVAGKLLGMTSIVQSAVRLHGHGMAAGQASAALAVTALEENRSTHQVVRDWNMVRKVQTVLTDPASRKIDAPGVLLWPYHDLPVAARHFTAANQLTMRGVWPIRNGETNFNADRATTVGEFMESLRRALAAFPSPEKRAVQFTAKGADDPIRLSDVRRVFAELGWNATPAAQRLARVDDPKGEVPRGAWAILLWDVLKDRAELPVPAAASAKFAQYLNPGHDVDGDGIADLQDPLPLDRNNDNLPDVMTPRQ